MAKISLVYWSGTGNTQAMADYVVEGVKSAGAEVDVFEVTEANADDVLKSDVILLGCPSNLNLFNNSNQTGSLAIEF